MAVVITRAREGAPRTTVLEVDLNNAYRDGVVKAKQLTVFRTGHLKGRGMLVPADELDEWTRELPTAFSIQRGRSACQA